MNDEPSGLEIIAAIVVGMGLISLLAQLTGIY